MNTECLKCVRAFGFNISQYNQCRECREKTIGKDKKKCRICKNTGPSEDFTGSLHKRCKYLRDKRIKEGKQLITVNNN